MTEPKPAPPAAEAAMAETRAAAPEPPVPAAPASPPEPEAPPEPPVSLASPELADRAGAVMSRPEVLEARAKVLASRETLATELDTLRSTARASLDPRVRVAEAARGAAENPLRTAGIAAAGIGGILGLRRLRGRKAKPVTSLPPEVEAALEGLGKDGKTVRAALDRSFTRYLQDYGAQPSTPSKVPKGISFVILPVAGQVAREVVRQVLGGRGGAAKE